mgnify:CR=1 FL=1
MKKQRNSQGTRASQGTIEPLCCIYAHATHGLLMFCATLISPDALIRYDVGVSNLVIEDGIAPPAAKGKGYTEAIRALKRGQSVRLPTTYGTAWALCAALCSGGERRPGEFRVRTVDGGARVWRVEQQQGERHVHQRHEISNHVAKVIASGSGQP